MIRLLFVAVLAGVFLTACPKGDGLECGDPGHFDTSSCNIGSLSQLNLGDGGIWNVQLTYDDLSVEDHVFNLAAQTIDNYPVSSQIIDGGTIFLSLGSAASLERQTFLACGSAGLDGGGPDPYTFGGLMVLCSQGDVVSTGGFIAERLDRPLPEGESSGVTLIGEIALDGGPAQNVTVLNAHAYVAGTNTLATFDVSDPANPVLTSSLGAADGDEVLDVAVYGGLLYVATQANALEVYSLVDPSHPVQINQVPAAVDGGPLLPVISSLSVDPSLPALFAADPVDGTVIRFDLTDAGNPTIASEFFATNDDPGVGAFPNSQFSLDGRLYVAHWGLGLVVSDESVPSPSELGSYSLGDSTSYVQVAAYGPQLIAFVTSAGWGGQLRTWDVTAPTEISQITQIDPRPEVSAGEVLFNGTQLYMTNYQSGLRLFDVSNPSVAPVPIGYFNTWHPTDPNRGESFYEGALGLAVPGDGYIYVTDTSRGLLILQQTP